MKWLDTAQYSRQCLALVAISFLINFLLCGAALADIGTVDRPLQEEVCYQENGRDVRCYEDQTCCNTSINGSVRKWCIDTEGYIGENGECPETSCGTNSNGSPVFCNLNAECCTDKYGTQRCMTGNDLDDNGECRSNPCDFPASCREDETCCIHNGIGACVANENLENGSCPAVCTTQSAELPGNQGSASMPVYCTGEETCCQAKQGEHACVAKEDAPDGECPIPCAAPIGGSLYCRAHQKCCADGKLATAQCVDESALEDDGGCPDLEKCAGNSLKEGEQCCNDGEEWICPTNTQCGPVRFQCGPVNECTDGTICAADSVCCPGRPWVPGEERSSCHKPEETDPQNFANSIMLKSLPSLPIPPLPDEAPVPCCDATGDGNKACPAGSTCCVVQKALPGPLQIECIGPDKQCCQETVCDKDEKCCFDECCAADEQCEYKDMHASCVKITTPTPTPSETPLPSESPTPSESPAPHESPAPTTWPTPAPSDSASPTSSYSPVPTPSWTYPTIIPSSSPTVSPTPTASLVFSPAISPTPSPTYSPAPSAWSSPTPSPSYTSYP